MSNPIITRYLAENTATGCCLGIGFNNVNGSAKEYSILINDAIVYFDAQHINYRQSASVGDTNGIDINFSTLGIANPTGVTLKIVVRGYPVAGSDANPMDSAPVTYQVPATFSCSGTTTTKGGKKKA